MTSSKLLSTSLTAGDTASPTIVRGEGVWLELADGRRVIDASNTAAPLGHGHPEIVEAVRRAASAPALNEGMRWAERELAADDLLQTAFAGEDWPGAVRFFISASEANDAALALCQALTGRANLATRERAYHGGAGLAREMTVQPQWHGGLSSPQSITPAPRLATVVELPAPSGARVGEETAPLPLDLGSGLDGCAAVILDYSQGGRYHRADYQNAVADAAREAGTYWIADETVTGFGRIGGWFQFQQGDRRPDLVTMGKSLAAGGAPAGAIVFSKSLLEQLQGSSWQTYSTFRGHPLEVAAIRAHLRVAARDRIYERARQFDTVMWKGLAALAAAHPSIARVDGRGLHWTIELRGPNWRDWRGQEAEPLASRVVAKALEADVLIATSGEQTSLFLAPPLIVSEAEVERIFQALDHGLVIADTELEREAA